MNRSTSNYSSRSSSSTKKSATRSYSRLQYSFSGTGIEKIARYLSQEGIPFNRQGNSVTVDLENPEPHQSQVIQQLIDEESRQIEQNFLTFGNPTKYINF